MFLITVFLNVPIWEHCPFKDLYVKLAFNLKFVALKQWSPNYGMHKSQLNLLYGSLLTKAGIRPKIVSFYDYLVLCEKSLVTPTLKA